MLCCTDLILHFCLYCADHCNKVSKTVSDHSRTKLHHLTLKNLATISLSSGRREADHVSGCWADYCVKPQQTERLALFRSGVFFGILSSVNRRSNQYGVSDDFTIIGNVLSWNFWMGARLTNPAFSKLLPSGCDVCGQLRIPGSAAGCNRR